VRTGLIFSEVFERLSGSGSIDEEVQRDVKDSDSHVEELIALVGDNAVARAAYREAVTRRPGKAHYASAKDATIG
jgi:hypothetical protein